MKKKILIIEDERDIREVLAYELEHQGYTVQMAVNGEQGLKQFAQMMPDLIILDLNMPVMGGREFYDRLCESSTSAPCPIIALTAEMHIDGLFDEFDVETYIAKPFNIDKVIGAVKLAISNRELSVEEGD